MLMIIRLYSAEKTEITIVILFAFLDFVLNIFRFNIYFKHNVP